MHVSVTPLVERIARARRAAHQRERAGQEESAGRLIDANWPDYCDDALAVRHTPCANLHARWRTLATPRPGSA